MTRKEYERQTRLADALVSLGFDPNDVQTLRRISMTLRRWHDRECGDGNGCIERDEQTGMPFWVRHGGRGVIRYAIPGRGKGGLRRPAAIMAKVPALSTYVQTDPRGAALYILRPGDVPEGKSAESYYSRGICVY